jgi:hypothetical protein
MNEPGQESAEGAPLSIGTSAAHAPALGAGFLLPPAAGTRLREPHAPGEASGGHSPQAYRAGPTSHRSGALPEMRARLLPIPVEGWVSAAHASVGNRSDVEKAYLHPPLVTLALPSVTPLAPLSC